MKPVSFGGHRLRLTIGALEQIAEANPAPTVVLGALKAEIYTLEELRAVLDAAATASDISEDSGSLIEKHGIQKCKEAALALMEGAFEIGGKKPAAKAKEQTSS